MRHIFTWRNRIFLDPIISDKGYLHKKTNNKWIDVKFFGILGTFTGHSISLGVDNGSLDGELHPQFMIKKKFLTSMIKKKKECYKLQS